MAYTADLVEQRFDDAQAYAEESIEKANEFMDVLNSLLEGLEQPETDELEDVVIPSTVSIDYASIPSFNEILNEFPTFAGMTLGDISLDDIPDISATVPTKNFNFIANTVSKPTISYSSVPEEPTLSSISFPSAPDLDLPTAPTISDITLPTVPNIDIAKFNITAPALETITEPGPFNFTEDAYNSDIRVALFNKILNDIANGGTGLDVEVEQDIWDRYLSRQINENDRLYQEIQNQFAATGFGLPSGAYASRLLQVSSEISAKNDNANRDIAIAQAELAQKNTQFTIEQAGILEKMLVDFFHTQQNRSLQAQQILAANAIEIYNATVARQSLLLDQYKTEAQVFESKIRAELAAVEAYRAEVDGVKTSVDVQQARVNLYNSQVSSLELFLKIYQTEMESTKVQVDVQNLQLGLFKTQIEAYTAQVGAENVKAGIYKTEVESEGLRAEAFKTEVEAYDTEIRARLGVLESERIKAANKIATNQLKLEEYRTKLEKYRTEIDAEVRTADLAVKGYQANTAAYQATIGAKEAEFRTKLAEYSAKIEVVRANLEKAKTLIDSNTNSYIALKELAIKGTEGIMNVNAQLAASAMNAVNASASQSIGSSSSDNENHNHYYDHGEI